jgi:hypothetical protein
LHPGYDNTKWDERLTMSFPVKLELFKEGVFYDEVIVEQEDDLYCRIEMLSGIGWLDAEPLYQRLLVSKRDVVVEHFRVCHSYEKWGELQQEVVNVKVRMHRIVK